MTVPYTGEARQPNILAPCIIFAIVSPLAVAARFYSRRIAGAGLWWDDWTVLIALVSFQTESNSDARLTT